jgi:two-component system sensor histidine kinase SenX3
MLAASVTTGVLVAGVIFGVVGFALGRLSRRPTPGGGEPTPRTEPDLPPPTQIDDEPFGDPATTPDTLSALAEAVDRIEHGVVVCDAGGNDLFRNRAAAAYLEARDGLVLVEAAVQDLLTGALEGHSVRREVDLFGPPAQSFLVVAHPFGNGSGALVVVEDRSLQRRTETVRRDFVANISHELKTPIGALGLLAETIRDEPDPEVVARLASRMISEAERAGRTVDDLLELSRIEFGDDSESARMSALHVVEEAIDRLASAAEHAGVAVLVSLDPALEFFGDRRQLVSAVFNLVDNAVKYSAPGSEVRVGASLEGPGWVELTVADEGIGIPRRDLDRVFERFYRVDRARSRDTGGTGLGLAIVRHVASNHGGEVTVRSTEGVGTTFCLRLPGDLPSRRPEPTRDAPPPVATIQPGVR